MENVGSTGWRALYAKEGAGLGGIGSAHGDVVADAPGAVKIRIRTSPLTTNDPLLYLAAMRLTLIQPRELFGPPERQSELVECWRRNDWLDFDMVISPSFERPTFSELFAACDPEGVNVIANSDIYFTEDAVGYMRKIKRGHCWALSRWDIRVGQAYPYHLSGSQDAWVFYGRPDIVADFTLGTPGCDNRIAHLLAEHYEVSNPCKTVMAFHLHEVQWRSYLRNSDGTPRGGDKIERVPPPYKLVTPCEL